MERSGGMAEPRGRGEHPSEEALRSFFEGTLAPEETRRVIRHLLPGCASCRAAFLALAQEEPDYDFVIVRTVSSVRRNALWADDRALGASERAEMELSLPEERGGRTVTQVAKQCEVIFQNARELRAQPKIMVLACGFAVSVAEELGTEDAAALGLQARSWAELANAKRLTSDFEGASQAFAMAYERLGEMGRRRARDPLLMARVMDLDASLRNQQRRYGDATQLLAWAHDIYLEHGDEQAAGRVLVKQGAVHGEAHEHEAAIETTLRGLELMDYDRDSEAYFRGLHNIVDAYASLGHYREARELLEDGRPLYEVHATGVVLLAVRGIEGRIAAGLGEFLPAVRAFTAARDGFADRELPYDAALVSLELALLWLEHGNYGALRKVLDEILLLFHTLDIERDAVAAVFVLYEAARKKEVTEALVRATAERLQDIQAAVGSR
jgi:tetratricopeptide (TPR) repeat protein